MPRVVPMPFGDPSNVSVTNSAGFSGSSGFLGKDDARAAA